jgi:hypothetical protein
MLCKKQEVQGFRKTEMRKDPHTTPLGDPIVTQEKTYGKPGVVRSTSHMRKERAKEVSAPSLAQLR